MTLQQIISRNGVHIEKLKELTGKLDVLHLNVNLAKVESPTGNLFIMGVAETKDYTISYVHGEKGAKLASHTHKEYKYIIMVNGCLEIETEGKKHTLQRGDSIRITPLTEHDGLYHEESFFLLITVPSSDEFPPYTKNVIFSTKG